MITQINHFPIINIMPGDGVGVIEQFMDSTYYYIFLASHNLQLDNEISVNYATNFADQTTFMIRFFNSYLPTILRLFIGIYAITKLAIKRSL